MSVNAAILLGNVGQEPEIRNTNSGTRVASFSLATSESWKDKETGQKKERVEWHKITTFNENLINIIEKYVRKGSKLYIEGKIQTKKWQDKSGADRYTTEIVLSSFGSRLELLDSKKPSEDTQEPDEDYNPLSPFS